ncbi:MAG: tRNA (adenosine(37)-N6)-threonylcarbamoyltransferase complex ATPase subunit type 1 TsaE [Verrucomicrobia bacterium]|nr:tRNA (adenosine(37)-N6)-threonylcarbamoyltransferase complex ATPase subunit type 1 TsaE [Verrucomicrobiota bacterium]
MTTVHTSNSPEETHAVARDLLANLTVPAVLALHGELGAGKTCFIQGLAAALGIRDAVGSPTYTLVNEYRGKLPLYHIDLYRVNSAQEAWALGLDEYLEGDGITAIEWAERAESLLPQNTLHLTFEVCSETDIRRITVQRGPRS